MNITIQTIFTAVDNYDDGEDDVDNDGGLRQPSSLLIGLLEQNQLKAKVMASAKKN